MFLERVGFSILDEKEKSDFEKLFEEYSKKINYKLKKVEFFRIHLKEYYDNSSGTKKRKYSIHIHLSGSGKTFEADSYDWDLKRALHKVFNSIANEIEHTFHVSEQHKKK